MKGKTNPTTNPATPSPNADPSTNDCQGCPIHTAASLGLSQHRQVLHRLEVFLREAIAVCYRHSDLESDDFNGYARKLSDMLEVFKTPPSDINWLLGDIAVEVHRIHRAARKLDKTTDLMTEFLTIIGENQRTFYVRRWVAVKFPKDRRAHPGLEWTHYRAAAGAKDPTAWIQEASQKNWTTRQLMEAIAAAKVAPGRGRKVTCDNLCGWQGARGQAILVEGAEIETRSFCSLTCLNDYYTLFLSEEDILDEKTTAAPEPPDISA